MSDPAEGRPRSGDATEAQRRAAYRDEEVHTVDGVPPALARIQADMQAFQYPRCDVFAVRIAVREALFNAVQHGHRGDPTRCVRLTYLVTPGYILAEVADEGPGFDPSQVPIPALGPDMAWSSGRGLYLMRLLMTWIRFNRQGNVCVLCKKRSPPIGTRPIPATDPEEEEGPCNRSAS